jgi:hypothetical protein
MPKPRRLPPPRPPPRRAWRSEAVLPLPKPNSIASKLVDFQLFRGKVRHV